MSYDIVIKNFPVRPLWESAKSGGSRHEKITHLKDIISVDHLFEINGVQTTI